VAIVPPKFCLLEHGNVNGLHTSAFGCSQLCTPVSMAMTVGYWYIIIVYFHFFLCRALMNTSP